MTRPVPRTRARSSAKRGLSPNFRRGFVRRDAGLAIPLGVLSLLFAAVVGGPLVVLVVGGVAGASSEDVSAAAWSADRLGTTLAVAAGIAVAACGLGWMLARVAACGGHWRRAVLALPLLMPPYLAYAGWSQARAPGTYFGDVLGRLASEGQAWVSMWTGTALALAGLALWVSPLVAVVVVPGLSRSERTFGGALRLDAGRLRTEWYLLCAHRWDLCRAGLLVAAVVAGSAVPLHLAQVETVSIGAWRDLAEHGPDEWWRGVVRVWPVLIAACAAGCVLARTAWGFESWGAGAADVAARCRPARGVSVAAWAVWLLATLVPVGLFAANLGPSLPGALEVLARWWSRGWRDAADSGIVAGVVGGGGLAVACAASLAASATRVGWIGRATLAGAAAVWTVGALVPGVLIGVALATPPVEGLGALACAHLARFGVVGVVAGLAAAGSEPRSRRDLRAIDGATGVRGWLGACLAAQWPTLVVGGLVVAVLSFHEIESSVILRPAGWGSLPVQLLEHLHFFRTRELASAVLVVVGGVLVVFVAVAAVGSRMGNRTRGGAVA